MHRQPGRLRHPVPDDDLERKGDSPVDPITLEHIPGVDIVKPCQAEHHVADKVAQLRSQRVPVATGVALIDTVEYVGYRQYAG